MGIRSFSLTRRQPPGSAWPLRLAWTVMAVAAIFFVVAAVRNLRRHDSLTQWRQSLEAVAGSPAWPAWSGDWPPLPSPLPQDLRGPYSYAARNKEVLEHIPCYCGCVREGHRSNLNCFVNGFRSDGTPIWTAHSFSCEMCVHIAREAMLMSSQGTSVERIREEIDKRYRMFGEPTNTTLASHSERRR